MTYDSIAAQTGLSRTGVFDICRRHADGGAKELRDAIGGRTVGEGRVLTVEQEREVQQLIRDKTADQIKLPYALWSRGAVAELVAERFGIRVPVRSMGAYLKRWGFTPQKLIRRAYEQSPTAVKNWLKTDFQRLRHRPRRNVPRFIGATRSDCARTHHSFSGGRTVLTSAGPIKNDGLIIACGGRFIKKPSGIVPVERLAEPQTGAVALGFAGNPNEPTAMRDGPIFEFLFGLDTQFRRESRREKIELPDPGRCALPCLRARTRPRGWRRR